MTAFLKKYNIGKPELVLVLLTALYVLIGYGIAAKYGGLYFFNPVMYVSTGLQFTKVFIMGYILFWGLWVFHTMIFKRPPSLKTYLWEDLQKNALNKRRYIRALPVFVCFIVTLSTFTSLKALIPYAHPFAWDVFFADLDETLHFGMAPWQLLHPLLGHPPVTWVINIVYNFWMLILYLMLYWQLLTLKDTHTRMQFFYTMLLSWAINGSFLAFYFSSAGPCYYEQVLDSDRFVPLMEYLRSLGTEDKPIWALVNQGYLWEGYITKVKGIGAGISAMPSIHVSTALIFMLVGLRSDKRFWKAAAVLFFTCILLGSVHLAWHYAVDGYFVILTTLPLWFLSGYILKKLQKGRAIA